MTDQNVPADLTPEEAKAAREWATDYLKSAAGSERVRAAARVVLATVPAPPRPTLADMTEEERRACKWMQADVANRSVRYVIANPFGEYQVAGMVSAEGEIEWFSAACVTPRPDLPPLEWPGTEKHAPALPGGWRLADHVTHGRVIVTNPTPDCYGTVYFAFPRVDCLNGFDWKFCDPDELTYIDTDQGDDTDDAAPESTLAVGSEWHNADALTRACEETGRDQITVTDWDGDVYVWDANLHDWRDLHPIQNYAPFTIIHTGREADQ